MDCRDAQAVVSALHDGERPSDEEIMLAAQHCRECASCIAFRDALGRLDAVPAPQPPPGLVERIMAAVDAAAAQDARASADTAGDQSVETVPARRSLLARWGLTPGRAWAAAGALAAAAALVIGIGIASANRSGQSAASTTSTAASAPRALAPESAGKGAVSSDLRGATAATPYLSFAGRVYRPGESSPTSASVAETIGTTASAFSSSGPPTTVTVHRTTLADGSIAVATPGGLQVFVPVVRALGSRTYQLTTGAEIVRYGDWPSLPSTYPVPARADGSPTFHEAGVDALGVTVYKLEGGSTDQGFAIAPGTAPGDPAGGNPNWTWWASLVAP
jgi:hypothetical protein